MSVNLVNVCRRALQARARVARGLAGARPRHIKKRFRRLLKPSGQTVVLYTPSKEQELPPERVELRVSILGLAGHLTMESARELKGAAELFTKNEEAA